MLNRKLLEILQRLEAPEIKRLRHFLQSPYFTYGLSSQDINKIFELIIKHDAQEDAPALDKRKVSALLFPDKPYTEKGKNPVDTLTSDLLRLTKHFLFIRAMEQNQSEAMQTLPLAHFYRKFGLEERFWQTVDSMRKNMEQQVQRDERFYLDSFYIEEEVNAFKSLYNSAQDDANIGAVGYFLDKFYTLARLEIACLLSYQSRMADFSKNTFQDLADALLQLTREGKFSEEPLAQIYLLIFDLIQNPEDMDRFNRFEHLLERHKDVIHHRHLADLYAYQRVFRTQLYVKKGGQESLKAYFDLITKHLEGGYLYLEGKVISAALRNITIYGLRLGEFDMVRKILEDHPPAKIVGTRYPEDFYNLILAEFHLALQDYDLAQQKLIYRNFENVNFSISADVLLIKIYFETSNELLDSRMRALQQKIRRSKIAPEIKDRYFNFLKKLDKIVKYGWDKRSPARAKLAEEIRKAPGLLEREWLLRQLQ